VDAQIEIPVVPKNVTSHPWVSCNRNHIAAIPKTRQVAQHAKWKIAIIVNVSFDDFSRGKLISAGGAIRQALESLGYDNFF